MITLERMAYLLSKLALVTVICSKVPEFCPALDEDGVREHSFDLILAFDEVWFCSVPAHELC